MDTGPDSDPQLGIIQIGVETIKKMDRKSYFQDVGQSVVLYEEVPMVFGGRETLVTRLGFRLFCGQQITGSLLGQMIKITYRAKMHETRHAWEVTKVKYQRNLYFTSVNRYHGTA